MKNLCLHSFFCINKFSMIIIVLFFIYGFNSTHQAQIELFKDIYPGTEGSSPTYVASAGSLAFFIANSPGAGYELWVTDGTLDGTTMVSDINSGEESSAPRFFSQIGNGVVFAADNGIYGEEPWFSDGTLNGTYLLKDLNLGQNSSIPQYTITFKDHVYFQALNVSSSDNLGVEMHRTENLPPNNASIFVDLNPGQGSSLFYPGTPFEVAGDYLYFKGRNSSGTTGDELWLTDGTVNGTRMVADIYPGPLSSNPQNLTALNSLLFFVANDSISGYEPWITDGTEEGTIQLMDIYPGTDDGANLSQPIIYNNNLYFLANDGTTGNELWVTDGTTEGTNMLKDIYSGSSSSFSFIGFRGIVYNDKLFFAANDGQSGIELWVTNGTEEGTMMFVDLNPDSGHTFITNFFIYNDLLFFVSGSLWVTDGTTAGTYKIIDLTNLTLSPIPGQFFEVGNNLFFQAADSVSGSELRRLVTPSARSIVTISGNGKIILGENTGIAITFSGINSSFQKNNNDSISLRVERYTEGLGNISGVTENYFSQYHWILNVNDSLNFDSTTAIHFLLSELINIEIIDPTGIIVYYRETPGAGIFTPLATYYDEINNEIVATGFENLGQFIFASDNELILPVNTDIILPNKFELKQNYPNPFNPSTTIIYSVPSVETNNAPSLQQVILKVYDILGREVTTLVNEQKRPGEYEVLFNANSLSSGVYFYQLSAGRYKNTKKLMLLR